MKGSTVITAVLVGGAAFFLGREVRPTASPFPRVIADTTYIYRERPVEVIRWRERIRWRTVPPVTVATGPEGQRDTAAVLKYCEGWVDTSRADTLKSAVLPDFRGRVTNSKLQLWSTLSDGRAFTATYRTRGQRYQWLSSGDTTIYREERQPFVLFRGLPGKALVFGLGMLTSKVLLD